MSPRSREKPLGSREEPVPQTDTGGRVEHTEAIGRTMVKELGKTAPQLREKGCRPGWRGFAPRARAGRSEEAQTTVYQKHRTLLKS